MHPRLLAFPQTAYQIHRGKYNTRKHSFSKDVRKRFSVANAQMFVRMMMAGIKRSRCLRLVVSMVGDGFHVKLL